MINLANNRDSYGYIIGVMGCDLDKCCGITVALRCKDGWDWVLWQNGCRCRCMNYYNILCTWMFLGNIQPFHDHMLYGIGSFWSTINNVGWLSRFSKQWEWDLHKGQQQCYPSQLCYTCHHEISTSNTYLIAFQFLRMLTNWIPSPLLHPMISHSHCQSHQNISDAQSTRLTCATCQTQLFSPWLP